MDYGPPVRPYFRDRVDAGQVLGARLSPYRGRDDVIVLALPRGGVPVANEVARALDAPLDIFLVRKLGLPGHEEFAMGAIASGGIRLINDDVVRDYGVRAAQIELIAATEQRELERRERAYRDGRPLPRLAGRTVILIDDGLATGFSMRAAVAAVREEAPARVVVAVPVAAPETCEEFRALVDQIVCAETPDPFYAVGIWYDDFSQTTDEEVHEILSAANDRRRAE
jgi:putative phosphoribosyl transferase